MLDIFSPKTKPSYLLTLHMKETRASVNSEQIDKFVRSDVIGDY